MNLLPVNQEVKKYLSENNTNTLTVRKQDITYFKQKIRGPMIPVITHYDENNQLDFNALEHNLNYILQFFKTGYGCLLGAAAGGDFSVLNLEERKQLISNLVNKIYKTNINRLNEEISIISNKSEICSKLSKNI